MEEPIDIAPLHKSIGEVNGAGNEGPPFQIQFDSYLIFCGDQIVRPEINAEIERGFFSTTDQQWMGYRRDGFDVSSSFTLSPHSPNQPLFISRPGMGTSVLEGFAMSISAQVSGRPDREIEIVRLTENNGPGLPIEMAEMAPTYHISSDGGEPTGSEAPSSPEYEAVLSRNHTFAGTQFRNSSRRKRYAIVVELFVAVSPSVGDGEMEWIKLAHRESVPLEVRKTDRPCYRLYGPHSCVELDCAKVERDYREMGISIVA
ncbi:hypothetical protein FKW77_010479 [Venturia effusa]|uniref:NDT80 domain-containing protein n=1 Tax=Venturia effusa TaxID=50376 RepID=A0A517L2E5_9PEZI|nr:hypothetical protein FKW77_010479 [Venturia effusa]